MRSPQGVHSARRTLRTTPSACPRARGVKGIDTAQIWLHRSWVSAGVGAGLTTSRRRRVSSIQNARRKLAPARSAMASYPPPSAPAMGARRAITRRALYQ